MYPIYNSTVEHNAVTANVLVCFVQANILIHEVDASTCLYRAIEPDKNQ